MILKLILVFMATIVLHAVPRYLHHYLRQRCLERETQYLKERFLRDEPVPFNIIFGYRTEDGAELVKRFCHVPFYHDREEGSLVPDLDALRDEDLFLSSSFDFDGIDNLLENVNAFNYIRVVPVPVRDHVRDNRQYFDQGKIVSDTDMLLPLALLEHENTLHHPDQPPLIEIDLD